MQVEIFCAVSALQASIKDVTYTVGNPLLTVQKPNYAVVPDICAAGVTPTVTVVATAPLSTDASGNLIVDTADTALLNTSIDLQWEVSIPAGVLTTTGAQLTASDTFRVNFLGQTCQVTSLEVQPSPIVRYDIGSAVVMNAPMPLVIVQPTECQPLV